MKSYREAVDYLFNIPRFSKIKDKARLGLILEQLGQPQNTFKYIHVAGTNGKGSVCAFLDSSLRALGIKTGLFTSPHLVKPNERFKVSNEDISDEDFVKAFTVVEEVVQTCVGKGMSHPTFFEYVYLMAMVYFKDQGVEYGIIETGMGGRLDATNVIEHPILTVITSISLDHTAILGDTIEAIAGEKAGIIKSDCPVIYDANVCQVQKVIETHAELKGAKALGISKNHLKILKNTPKDIDFSLDYGYSIATDFSEAVESKGYNSIQLHLNTGALYQTMNSSLAFVGLLTLYTKDESLRRISLESYMAKVIQGLANTRWPGRMEAVNERVYIDGAHNEDGIEQLAQTLEGAFKGQDLYCLFAVAEDKDYNHMVERLCKIPDLKGVIITEIDNGRRTDMHSVARAFEKNWHGPLYTTYNISEAYAKGQEWIKSQGILICAGSLYLAGSIKAFGGFTND